MPAMQLTFLSALGGMKSILLPPKLLPHGQAALGTESSFLQHLTAKSQ